MAEVLRTEIPSQDAGHPTNTTTFDDPMIETGLKQPELPATASPANNPAWNRSAEVVGRSVGTAVAEVRCIPRRLDGLKSRLHLVSESASATARGVRNSAEAKATALRDAAEVGLLEFADKAAVYAEDAGLRTSARIERLRRQAWWKLEAVRTIARHRLVELGEWEPERPLQVIVVGASAAFALGVMLRIWRSSRD